MKNERKELIKKALLDAEMIELEAIEKLKCDAVHTEEFLTRTEGLIEEQRPVRFSYRRVAAVIIAATLLIALCVPAIAYREPIGELLTDIFEKHIVFSQNPDGAPDEIKTIYTLNDVPTEYEEDLYLLSDIDVYTVWSNGDNIITLQQTLLKNGTVKLNTEDRDYHTRTIGNLTIHCTYRYNCKYALWSDGEYVFIFGSTAEMSWQEIERAILNVCERGNME